ncbi:MAG: DUF2634 domain-containing protein [bacterium]
MLPTRDYISEINIVTHPSKTYKVNFSKSFIKGYCDDLQSLAQSIYKIFMTPRYIYPIYDWNYGIEIDDLIGMPKPYIKSQLERRIKDALSTDDRINLVYDFEFTDLDENPSALLVSFYINSIFGDLNFTWEV